MSGTVFPTTFTTNERANSQPVKFYTFLRGDRVWRYTDQKADVTDSGVTYRAAAIAHADFQKDEETAAGETTITCAEVTPIVADLDAIGLGGLPIGVTIRQTHANGIGGVSVPTTVVRFKGRVTARTFRDGVCEFRVASVASLIDRPILRVVCSPTCNHTVYDTGCAVDASLFTATGCAISAITGRVLTVADAASQADGYYTAGFLRVENGTASGERAFIADHTGSALTLMGDVPPGLTTSDTIAITAGCDGLEATCRTKFSNIHRFLGFPRVPQVNPFDAAV